MNRMLNLGAASVLATAILAGCQQDESKPHDHTMKSSSASTVKQSDRMDKSAAHAETASSYSMPGGGAKATASAEAAPGGSASVNAGGATQADASVATASPSASSASSTSGASENAASPANVTTDPTATPAIAAQASNDAHPAEGAAVHLSPGVEGTTPAVTAPEAGAATPPATPAAADPTNPSPAVAAPATPTPEATGAAPAVAAPTAPAATAEPAAAKEKDGDHAEHHGAMAKIEPAQAAQQKVTGTVHFMSAGEHGVKVVAELKGLTPNSKHGFHIHEKADLSAPDLKSAGGHFNPTMSKHGGPEGDMRHGGDLGNIQADAEGNAKYEVTVHGVTLDGAKDGVIGHSVIIHEKADDMKTDPAGDSGARIAGGVIKAAHGDKSESADAGAAQAQPAAAPAAAAPVELSK